MAFDLTHTHTHTHTIDWKHKKQRHIKLTQNMTHKQIVKRHKTLKTQISNIDDNDGNFC
jgi:hypothetical protein